MSVETTSKHLVAHVGDKVIVTDINICQRVLPAIVEFKGILQVVKVDHETGWVSGDFEGHKYRACYEANPVRSDARRKVALKIADMLEGNGVLVTGRLE